MPPAQDSAQTVEVDGRLLRLSNLGKVLYPAAGTSKGEVIAYYHAVAPVILPHLADRALTRKRWPDGVGGQPFFEKNVPQGTPAWVRTVRLPTPGSASGRETIVFPLVDDLAGLVWLANLAALELHIPQWRVGPRGKVHGPDRLVVDLDPGPPAGLAECTRVALAVRERLAADGLDAYPVTSGSKGMQLYVPISAEQDAMTVHTYAKRLAEELERDLRGLVVSRMTKAIRPGRVLIDWSQNHPGKTTICPYSLRGRAEPWVAAPRAWAELEAAADDDGEPLVQLREHEVLGRVAELGDPLEGLFTPGPTVPV